MRYKMNQNDNYLTISQLAKACSTSRSTILRMEQDGILTPTYVNTENGYRFYDSSNVLRVSRNMALQDFGITHKELKKYYDNNNYSDLLTQLESKLALMEYHISSLRLQLMQTKHLSLEYFSFRELYCYTETMHNITELHTIRPQIWNVFSRAIQKGYSLDRSMQPFVIVDVQSIAKNNYKNLGYDYKICIPVLKKKSHDELEHFPACHTVSSILYGGSKDIKEAFIKLYDEIEKNDYISQGSARVITIVSSVPGEDIPMNYWVIRICMPYKSR